MGVSVGTQNHSHGNVRTSGRLNFKVDKNLLENYAMPQVNHVELD